MTWNDRGQGRGIAATDVIGGKDEAGAAVIEAGDVGDQISRGQKMNTGKKYF